ncbi:glycosyltransferase [Cellulomonas sp. IC4_254]|uniref:glycosyltransferase family 2 protein n=1 Tax=Cellulomonas sp. IC4_254 TaxID=2714040 RepID=UPI00142235BC|nr:glycosyltransferase [Cellulomonas sp. IC4_254]NHT16153.1 glycosyltransferase [Cellulomonas sp. IC4_254]
MSPVLSVVLLGGGDDATVLRTARSLALDPGAPARLVADPGSVSPQGREAVDAALPRRVEWVGGPLGARAAGAGGDYLGLLAPGDELEPGVLSAAAEYLAARPEADVLYVDEQWDAPGIEGIHTKPGWAPHYLEGWDYLGRLCLVRRTLAERVGGVADDERAAEWDLHLRVTEATDRVEHLPVIGVTRLRPPSTDPADVEAGRRAVAARYERLGVPATVEVADPAGYLRVWRTLPEPPPLVSVVIPTGGGRRDVRGESTLVVETAVRSLVERTTYPRWEIVLVASENTPEGVVDVVRDLAGDRLTVAPVTGEFSFSHSVNEGVRVARGDLVVLLNDDTEVVEPRWLDRMVAVAQDPGVGAVGAKLLFEDGTIQHVGIVHDDAWLPVHAHRVGADDASHFGAKIVDVDYLAVTAACVLVPRDLYLELGGFSEELPMAFNDVDFCHKVVAAGRSVVCTPFATLFHYESSSRVADVRPFERQYLVEKTVELAKHDPHVNHRSVR